MNYSRIYVGLCHRDSVQVEVKSRGGQILKVNQLLRCCSMRFTSVMFMNIIFIVYYSEV